MLKCLLLFLLPCVLSAFELSPWFTPLAEFNLRSSYHYREGLTPWLDWGTWLRRMYNDGYRGSYLPWENRSFDQSVGFNLGVSFRPNWEGQIETRFCVHCHSVHMQWIGAQVRSLVMNDVAGDPLSVALGGQLWFVTPKHGSLDPGFPHYPRFNGELGVSVGKEMARIYDWRCRGYAFLGLGMHTFIFGPNLFSLHSFLSGEIKCGHHHQFELFAEGYFNEGLDPRDAIGIHLFGLYRESRHQCIDIGVGYSYLFKIWGSFGVRYTHRVYAKSIPSKHLKMLTVEYTFPFSIF